MFLRLLFLLLIPQPINLGFFGSCQIEFLSEAQIGGYPFDTVVQVVNLVSYFNSKSLNCVSYVEMKFLLISL